MATIDVLSGVTPYKSEYVALPKFDRHLDIYGAALNKIDEAHHKAMQQRSTIEAAIAEIKLNKKEDAWKAQYAENILKEIDKEAEYGNYSTALSKAIEMAGKAVSDPALRSRARYNEQYEKELDKVRNMQGLSQDAKEWWIETNPYDYKDKTDSNGEIIGGNEFKPEAPVKSIDWAAETKLAFDLVTPYKNASSKETTTQGSITSELFPSGYTTTKNAEGSSRQVVEVKKEAIIENLRARFNNEDFKRQVEQAWKVENHSYSKLEKEYEELNRLLNSNPQDENLLNKRNDLKQQLEFRKKLAYKNGSPITSLEDYYLANIENNAYANNLKYKWVTSSSSSTNVEKITSGSSTGTGNNTNTTKNEDFVESTQGASVSKKSNIGQAATVIDNSAQEINEFFKTNIEY